MVSQEQEQKNMKVLLVKATMVKISINSLETLNMFKLSDEEFSNHAVDSRYL